MKIDMHVHCLPVSLCAKINFDEVPPIFKDGGIDGFVLVNHCYPNHCCKLGDTLEKQAKEYLNTYLKCKEEGEKQGIKVFFGVELKLINEEGKPEFLLYGISEETFLNTYPLYNLSQKELFDFCNKHNILMVQAHPFREEQGYSPADPKYMHGIEVYNPHPYFDARFETSLSFAEENGLLKTAGSDFHYEGQVGNSGMVIPDNVTDQFMLRDYLKTKECVIYNKEGVFYSEKE